MVVKPVALRSDTVAVAVIAVIAVVTRRQNIGVERVPKNAER